MHGCAFKLYQSLGGTGSWLGFPISDEYDVPGGRRSDFENGFVFWDEQDVDRLGSDYQNFDLSEARYELCRDACANDPSCRAYSYVKPGIQALNARCWLKSSVSDPVPSPCFISGVKQYDTLANICCPMPLGPSSTRAGAGRSRRRLLGAPMPGLT